MSGLPLIVLAAVSSCSDSIPASPIKEEAAVVGQNKFFALKTNVAPWAGCIMNVAWEMQFGNKFSIEVPVCWSPYFFSHKYALRTFAVQPELRYWLGASGYGHFFGVHPGVAWYNLRFKDIRYQDSGMPLVNVGVSYGYTLQVNRHLNAEFSIGAGFVKTKYDRYYNISNGAKIDTRKTSYWGIDRLELSLVYHFDL